MGLLRILDLAVIAARSIGNVLRAKLARRLRPSSRDRLFRERGRVSSHIRDPTLLVEALGNTHGL